MPINKLSSEKGTESDMIWYLFNVSFFRLKVIVAFKL